MKKSIRKITALFIALTLAVSLAAICPAMAGGGEPGVMYIDIDDRGNYSKNYFPEWASDYTGEFVFEAPDGTLINAKFDYSYSDGNYFPVAITGVNQLGKYTLKSFPVPKGYEVAGVFCQSLFSEVYAPVRDGFIADQKQLDFLESMQKVIYEGEAAAYIDISVYIRKADSAYPSPVPFALPTSSTVLVNGAEKSFVAYNINDNNYFKLRDLAFVLNGTEKQFEVSWDAGANAISLTSGAAYTPVGGELPEYSSGWLNPALPTGSRIFQDGEAVSFTAYNIEDNNYFKLRDIGAAFDFAVEWDGENNTIVIDTSKGYTAG